VVKWNKQTFNDFEVAPSLGVEMMKAQLFAVTNVPVEKQKIMFKGKILKVGTHICLVNKVRFI
jgi:ubiquitin carboxyl-terminal hydrolase 14